MPVRPITEERWLYCFITFVYDIDCCDGISSWFQHVTDIDFPLNGFRIINDLSRDVEQYLHFHSIAVGSDHTSPVSRLGTTS